MRAKPYKMKSKINIISQLRFFYPFLVILILLSVFSKCNDENQVIANYEIDNKKGTFIRKQLRWLVQLQAQRLQGRKATTEEQQQLVKAYLFSKLIAHDIDTDSLIKSDLYKEQSFLLKERVKLTAYELYLRNLDQDLEYKFIETQVLFLKKDEKDTKEKDKEADELIIELNSDKISDNDVIEKIYQRSENPSYKLQGGYLEPICTSCGRSSFHDFIEKLNKSKPGKFIKIDQGPFIWIIRIAKKYSIDEDDIQDKLESFYRKLARVSRKYINKLPKNDPERKKLSQLFEQDKMENLAKQKSERFIKQAKQSYLQHKISQLRESNNFSLSEEFKNFSLANANKDAKKSKQKLSNDSLLYTLDGKKFLYRDLKAKIEIINNNAGTVVKQKIKGVEKELQILNGLLIPLALLEKVNEFKTFETNEIYKFIDQLIRNKILKDIYYIEERKDSKIDEAEVQKRYLAGKKTRFKNQPTKVAKEMLRRELRQSSFLNWEKKKQKELSTKYKLKINNNLLKSDEI